jgi:DNA-binding response OmpR family regulator
MRILIIEDQEKLALSIKKGLENHGYIVDTLFDGGQGMRRLEFNFQDYDLAILDIMLPTVDGITVCKVLREKGITLPILMLTAKDTLDDKVEGLNIGADDYLIKPFAFEELVARIGALLRRPVEVVPVEMILGGIILNTITRIVTKNGKEVILTVKEFAILEQFLRHPNVVLSREKILSNSWDFAFNGFSNVVDVHIKNLRKKLQNKNETLFETIHGVGYRFNP